MNILITGGAGYIGSSLVANLLSKGHYIRVLDIGLYGFEQLIGFLNLPNFELRVGDIRNIKVLSESLSGMDAVIHLAALVGEGACNISPSLTEAINYIAVCDLLKLCSQKNNFRMIFLSTCSNYGVSNINQLADEETELNPLSLYSKTKVAAEKEILKFNSNTICTILRLGTICGISPRMRFDLLISELAIKSVQKKKVEIYKPEAWRPFLHLKDAINSINLVLEKPSELIKNKVFNVVKENIKKRYLGEIVKKHYPETPIVYTTHNPDDRDYRVSAIKLEKELGYICKVSVEEAFLETTKAIENNLFRDPNWIGHSAIPTKELINLITNKKLIN